jgi:hypothetical protein
VRRVLLGGVSSALVDRAHCPVLIVPASRARERVRLPLRIRHAEPAFVA